MKHWIVLVAALLGLTGCVSGDPGYVGGPYRPVYDARPAVVYDARPPVIYRDRYRPRVYDRDYRDHPGRRDRADFDRRGRFRDDDRRPRSDFRSYGRADPRFSRPPSPRYDARRTPAALPIARAERLERPNRPPAAANRAFDGRGAAAVPPRGPRPYTPPRPAV